LAGSPAAEFRHGGRGLAAEFGGAAHCLCISHVNLFHN
jgi:hypothetical protein